MKKELVLCMFTVSVLIAVLVQNIYAGVVKSIIAMQVESVNFLPFDEVPLVYADSPQVFTTLWDRANTETIRVAIFGDSQETSPAGRGDVYVARMNYEAFLRYGSVSETRVSSRGEYGNGSFPGFGAWLLNGTVDVQGESLTRLDSTLLLPNIGASANSTKNFGTNINGQRFGRLTVLRPDGLNLPPGAEVPLGNYFCAGSTVRAQVFASTFSSSGEINYISRPTNNVTIGDFTSLPVVNNAMVLGLENGVYDIKFGFTDPLPFNGFEYQQLELVGTDDSKLTEIVGMRYVSDSCVGGMVFQDFSAGGYTAKSFLTNHSNADKLFKALEFHAAIIHVGANDVIANTSAVEFYADIKNLISMIRRFQNNDKFPIILMVDSFVKFLNTSQTIEYDKYAGVEYEIARKDSYVKFVNTRRATDALGLRESDPITVDLFLIDSVHYTDFGGRIIANIDINGMLD